MSVFGVLHGLVRTSLILACSLPFFSVDLGHADWLTAGAIIAVGSISLVGLGILSGILPLLYLAQSVEGQVSREGLAGAIGAEQAP